MIHKLIVTHPAPRSGQIAVSVGQDNGRVLGVWEYRVEVEAPESAGARVVGALALKQSEPLHNAALQVWFDAGSPAPAQALSASLSPLHAPVSPIPSKERRQPPEDIFDPDEIMPYVLAARRDAVAVANRPIRLELSSDEATASTDCRAYIRLNPQPFLRGQIEAGFGRVYHEASHIRFDRDAPQLLEQASQEGGGLLTHILNLVLDRRSDDLNARAHRGFARALRRRMGSLMPGSNDKHGVSDEARHDVLVDFAYACKKRTRPRHAVVHRCVRFVRQAIGRVNRSRSPYAYLLGVSRRVRDELLAAMPADQREREEQLQRFENFIERLLRSVHGKKAGPKMQAAFRQAMRLHLGAQRRMVMQGLATIMAQMPAGVVPGAGASAKGTSETIKVAPNPAAYAASLARVRHLVPGLRRALEELSQPIVIEHKGLDHGDLDEDELAQLAAGGTDVFLRVDERPELDVAIAFVVDVSSSMSGRTETIDMGTLMNEALLGHAGDIDASLWGFHDDVFECGRPCSNNGIASLTWDGGTNETAGLLAAGNAVMTSTRRHKLVVVACDGGPADPVSVARVCGELLSRGVVPIRLLVGVDAAPRTYPVELFFDSFDEVLPEMADFFRGLMLATRT